MRILIVDDSEDGCAVAEAMLIAAGYQNIRTADSAAQAYRFLGINGPGTDEPPSVDLVLLDIVMPDVDGIEACARIRSEPRYAHVPVLTEPDDRKLAKSRRSVRADTAAPLPQLLSVFSLLGMTPPAELSSTGLAQAWTWAIAHWDKNTVPNRLNLRLAG